MSKVYVFMADGTEEVEALTVIDFSLELITLLVNAESAENIAKAVQYR